MRLRKYKDFINEVRITDDDVPDEIGDLPIGKTVYIVPWALRNDKQGECYLHKYFGYTESPKGTSKMKIKRVDDGFIAYIKLLDKSDRVFSRIADGEMGNYVDVISFDDDYVEYLAGQLKRALASEDYLKAKLIKNKMDDLSNKKKNESINESDDPSKYTEVTDELKTLIEGTIKNSGGEYKSFVESFLKNPEEVKIEGLINESDIYDFYLKYRNQIDEVLNTIKFYQTTPEEMNVFGLYDFTITGTLKAVEEFAKML